MVSGPHFRLMQNNLIFMPFISVKKQTGLKRSLLFLFVLLGFTAAAQIGGDNTYTFLKLSPDARITALGGTNICIYDHDLNTQLANPASLNRKMNGQAAFSTVIYPGGVNFGNVAYARRMRDLGHFVSISSGVKPHDFEVIDRLASDGVGADYITIDIAHGHAESVRHMIEHIKQRLPQAFVIAGNVGTPEGVIDLENWGADATKVGIGPGKVCITRLKTGFGTGGWQLSALKWCARVATKPIIADGGIRHHGDIAKSVRFGAAMVMVGSLFAGHEESPGATVEVDGKLYKEYYGSASDFNKGEYKHVEGKRILEPIKGKLADTLREMHEDVQSSISYAGGRVLADLKRVNYVILGGENAGEHLFM